MPDKTITKERVFPDHPVVSAILWHFAEDKASDFPRGDWFTENDLAEIESFTNSRRIDEWLSVRIALKSLMLQDGVAESALQIGRASCRERV